MNFDWTDDRIGKVIRLFAEGLTHEAIARELGGGVTRNAVIGKCFKMGLKRGDDRGNAHRKISRPKPRKPRTIVRLTNHGNRFEPSEVNAPAPLPRELPADKIPMAQRVSLLDLTAATCHFPYGDPGHVGFFFCGGVVSARPPYCAYHARLAFAPNQSAKTSRAA
jgi:GcrA cell cycle regulator